MVFRFYGLREDTVSDRGPQFTSRVWAAFFTMLGVNISLTSGYHPQSNGQIERFNQELTSFLRSYCSQNQNDWSHYIMWAEYAQNSLHKPSTGTFHFNVSWDSNPHFFLGQVNPQMFLLSMTGCSVVKIPGIKPMST